MFILAEYFRCTYLATTEKEVTNQNFLHYLLSFAISKINRIPSKHRVFLPKLALLKAFWALLATSPIYRTQQLVEKLTLASNWSWQVGKYLESNQKHGCYLKLFCWVFEVDQPSTGCRLLWQSWLEGHHGVGGATAAWSSSKMADTKRRSSAIETIIFGSKMFVFRGVDCGGFKFPTII